ncbi:MAG: hypothetical protein ABJB98_06000 [Actinomycetota bacterium]
MSRDVGSGAQASWAGWRASAALAVRQLAAITAVGALLGLLVGGVGGRLAMMLLARLNPEATGVTSDDGFTIGQFTLSDTLNFLLVGTFLGVVGAGIYDVLRGLRIGPRWFQVHTLALGPAVVVGAVLVHTDGVDFQVLEPTWLAIGLFVAIPGAYAALLTLLAEGIISADGWWARAPLLLAVAPLLLWVPVAPLLVFLAAGWSLREGLCRTKVGAAVVGHPALRWAARLGLTLIFAVASLDLGRDAVELI